MKNRLTFLGTGTSTGVPVTCCHCPTCSSTDPRDKRLRCSALLQTPGENILLDCSPDFRHQMLRLGFASRIHAVLLTHEHYDHVGGLDDLRPYSNIHPIPLHAHPLTAAHLRQRLPYCLVSNSYPGVPQLSLCEMSPMESVMVGQTQVTALDVMHGKLPILGFRIGRMAYITDMTSISPQSLPLLRGIELLVVNALRHKPHHSHQTIEQAIRFARQVGPQPTYLTHMSHDTAPHATEEALLPPGIHMAHDGLVVEF